MAFRLSRSIFRFRNFSTEISTPVNTTAAAQATAKSQGGNSENVKERTSLRFTSRVSSFVFGFAVASGIFNFLAFKDVKDSRSELEKSLARMHSEIILRDNELATRILKLENNVDSLKTTSEVDHVKEASL